ncbi:MAG: T9SS type A sorting domain-containing protein, partial [Flavobacteriales bacterium]
GLIHPNVAVQQMEGLADPFLDGSYSFDSFSAETNAIGHDWKSFVPGQGYSIEAERCYFVADSYGDVWRMVFTGFGGSATGEINFGLLEAETIANSVAEAPVESVRFYPNPLASGQPLTVTTERAARVRIFATTGSQIIDEQLVGLVQLNLPELTSGLYIVEMTEANGTRHTQQLIVR